MLLHSLRRSLRHELLHLCHRLLHAAVDVLRCLLRCLHIALHRCLHFCQDAGKRLKLRADLPIELIRDGRRTTFFEGGDRLVQSFKRRPQLAVQFFTEFIESVRELRIENLAEAFRHVLAEILQRPRLLPAFLKTIRKPLLRNLARIHGLDEVRQRRDGLVETAVLVMIVTTVNQCARDAEHGRDECCADTAQERANALF